MDKSLQARLEASSIYDEIVLEWRRVKAILDEKLRVIAGEASETGLDEVSKYIVRGGKRFRGFLTLVTARALGASLDEALDAAIAIELVHSASLAIDDIIDRDTIRRGARVAWIIYGVEKTVLASLLMIPVAQRMVEKYGFKALAHVIRAWEATVRGEIVDAFATRRLKPHEYIELVELKTGSLFKLSTQLGAVAARADWALAAVEEYGLKLGVAYQLADDITDYYKYHKGMKEKLDPSEELFERWAREELGATSPEDVVEKARQKLEAIVYESSKALDSLPDNRWKRILQALPWFMAEKMLEEAGLA